MTEPVTASALGIKLGWTLAGFAGGIVSLSFLKGISRWQAVSSVFAGAATATYFTPVVSGWFNIASESSQNCAAFVLGLCAMSIVPLVMSTVSKIAKSKADTIAPEGDGK
jgi:hypothetical protein